MYKLIERNYFSSKISIFKNKSRTISNNVTFKTAYYLEIVEDIKTTEFKAF